MNRGRTLGITIKPRGIERMSELETVTYQVPQWTGGTWEDLVRDADEVFGADLEEGDNLIGMPFAVVKMTFRPGEYANGKTGEILNVNGGSVLCG